MKFKKILPLIFSGIVVVGVASLVTLSIVKSKNSKTNIINNNLLSSPSESGTRVNYNQVQKELNNMDVNEFTSSANNKLTIEQAQKILDLQKQYFNLFKSNNYSLEEIQSYMCNNFPEYKKQIGRLSTNFQLNANNHLLSQFSIKSKDELKKQIGALVSEKWVLVGVESGLLGITAGFWATFMWYWAGLCTAASSALGAMLGCLCSLIDRINEYIDNKISEDYVKGQINGLKTTIITLMGTLEVMVSACPATGWVKWTAIGSFTAINISVQKVLENL